MFNCGKMLHNIKFTTLTLAFWNKERQCNKRQSSKGEHMVTMWKLNPNTPFQMGDPCGVQINSSAEKKKFFSSHM